MCGGSGKSDGGKERERARATSQVPVGYMAYVYVADSYVCSRLVCMCARMYVCTYVVHVKVCDARRRVIKLICQICIK